MKNSVINPNVREIPQSHDKKVWKEFFEKLMAVDRLAPCYATYYHFEIVYGLEEVTFPCVDCGFYYDIGIEISADDRYPANEAAVATGFIEKGITQMIAKASMGSAHANEFMSVIRAVFGNGGPKAILSEAVVNQAKRLLSEGLDIGEDADEADENCDWADRLRCAVIEDPNVATSVLGYFLEAVTGKYCTIFCPLGCAEYEEIGKEMAKNRELLETAKAMGLLAAGVETYFGAALDNDCNWSVQYPGVKYIIEDPELRCFVPARYLYVAERLIRLGADEKISEDVWHAYSDSIWEGFGNSSRGY